MAQRRTTHRSSKGTKLYAVRKEDGTFADIQTYKRAHAADLRRSAAGETSAKSKAATSPAKKAVKQAVDAGSGLLARAKKAVAGMVDKVSAATKPAKKDAARKPAAKKATAKRPAKKTGRKAAKKAAA